MTEFSVEPPGHSDDEYEVMEQTQPSHRAAELQTHLHLGPETHCQSPTELNPHRPLSLDINSRHTKSLSLPYMTSPVHGPEESCSEEDVAGEDSEDNDYSSEEDESMFVKSLPPDFFLSNLTGLELDADTLDGVPLDGLPEYPLQSSEEREHQSVDLEFSACKESSAGDQEQVEEEDKDEEDKDGEEEKEITKEEEEDGVHHGRGELENNR